MFLIEPHLHTTKNHNHTLTLVETVLPKTKSNIKNKNGHRTT